jgi:hypothetical protein
VSAIAHAGVPGLVLRVLDIADSSDDPEALTTGEYWYHGERRQPHRAVKDQAFQDLLLQALAQETGVVL